ncbi:sodium-dependent neutral amino acid transporter B(0)AT2-like [Epinephelus lanceolatus]|uniref:sodium-dependent neutral amino acid transporter B(0)AT2-like n=1 Tax=Epinephelus lanceolatus TaxID=310571 RepID=UPI0014486E05|nr:sodium-dependent neutral amino acid transporter B(0)AT2-like [Epinephelus lanceolatus]XP_033467650.1 sodium-dependent neutral amino acid transporter B(0)AT2-like [Epinephelus lanceolatus]XP_033467651.1 sodium-dependent neutral amino acid transporter B(0)AT2-like [Epinephelus lanceolatus]XP_033467652.1 sodium-dependent neutral amino acid transporter B(0)AT2-like [Epinephelus lanceolatus]XP_033467653.1 sodium-dependent neutral amino acid transporter B(0)AT2-like [Epinephelus lanceolatus]
MEKQPLPTDDNKAGTTESEMDGYAGEESQQGSSEPAARAGWNSKIEYFLAQVGFSVGLGNVWRFPYLCHQNGGGAFLLLYVLLMLVVGIPLFFLELAAGQAIRQGSIGVWKYISPRLAGIGYSSCVVCFFVALYYNVILAWSLFYLGNSFQFPLPWEQCPEQGNVTVKECEKSSPTSYFWYRKALDITDSIDETGSFNTYIVCCLLAAWTIVCLGMFKGIKTSVKVMYFSSIFPYVVLFCFLVRGLLLDGALEGITHMFYPKLEIWGDIQVWRQAATQVFFALGLGFGSIIAYSSYNPKNNNCHRDAFTVSTINFLTSVLATLVVFAVLGFRAKNSVKECVVSNIKELSEQFRSSNVEKTLMPNFDYSDPSSVALEDYRAWFNQYGSMVPGNLTDCDLEKEMQQGVEGTGLAFIAFTEAMSLLPGSPFWSALFFLMLLNLGLSTMFGTMEGILAPLTDRFKTLANNKTKLTIFSCILGFLIGLLFTQRCGNYFVTMFDDYSATLPLIIVVVFECFSVSWLYGADRFLDDIEGMLGWRPHVIYKYLWKYICLLAMLGLLGATTIRMFIKRPTYLAWNQEKGSEEYLEYPGWALAVLALLIIFAMMPVPVALIHAVLQDRTKRTARDTETGQYSIVSTDDKCDTPMTVMSDLDRTNGSAASFT